MIIFAACALLMLMYLVIIKNDGLTFTKKAMLGLLGTYLLGLILFEFGPTKLRVWGEMLAYDSAMLLVILSIIVLPILMIKKVFVKKT